MRVMQAGVVVIGRNEGERLVRSLESIVPQARRVIYVDSGSSDDSMAQAKRLGADVLALDMSVPFTAARARNAGFEALMADPDAPSLVQFFDGDCAMADGWIDKATANFVSDENLGLVTGIQAERSRDVTVFNQMSDVEWKRPAGDILACSGNMMVRALAFQDIGGFNPTVIAAEDDEMCTRMRKAGWRLIRISEDMALHDGGTMRFSQWWRRAERTGHGFAQVGQLHPDYFVRERQRGWVYGLFLPWIAVFGAFASLAVPVLVAGIYVASYWRTSRGLEKVGLPKPEALRHSVFLTLSKIPNVIGMIRFYWRRMINAQMRIIEYK